MRQVVAHLPFFAVVIDRSHRYLWVNRLDATLELKQVIGHRNDEFVHESCKTTARAAIERAFETERVTYHEARGFGDGEMETWYGVRVVPLPPDEDGQATALLLTTDVTL